MALLIQGKLIPKMLKQGQYHCGLQVFVAVSRGGDALTAAKVRASPHLAQQALAALAAVHQLGVLHGDVKFDNFVASPDCKAVWLVDFELSCCGDAEELALEQQECVHLLNCLALDYL